jgi:hypothetical protein
MGLDTAISNLAGKLGITESDLYGDPVANSNLAGALYNALSSGTQVGTLPDGFYNAVVIYFDEDNLTDTYYVNGGGISNVIDDNGNRVGLTISISDGTISGTVNGTTSVIRGKIHGSSLVLDIVDDPNTPTALTRVTGSIGLLGSVTGVYTDLDSSVSPPELTKGIFIASFIPASGVNPAAIANVVQSIYTGERHVLYRDIFGDDNRLRWGDITIAGIGINNNVTASNLTIMQDAGTTADVTPMTLTFNDGELLTNENGIPENIIALEFVDETGSIKAYSFQPVGSRRGIYVAIQNAPSGGNPVAIGESYMAKTQSLAPSLKANTSYAVQVAVAHPGLLGFSRDDALANAVASDIFNTPDASNFVNGAAFVNGTVGDEPLTVFNGSMMAFKMDDNDDGLSDPGQDFIRLIELYETGAMQGEEMTGGCANSTDPTLGVGTCDATLGFTDPLKRYPATFVGFIREKGTNGPTFSGKLNFLARALYAWSYSDYENAYVTGTITISGSSATLDWADAGEDSDTATLAAENENDSGLYHLYGALDSFSYIDIYWPVGGTKATYIVTDNSSGTVVQVGEAYLTY